MRSEKCKRSCELKLRGFASNHITKSKIDIVSSDRFAFPIQWRGYISIYVDLLQRIQSTSSGMSRLYSIPPTRLQQNHKHPQQPHIARLLGLSFRSRTACIMSYIVPPQERGCPTHNKNRKHSQKPSDTYIVASTGHPKHICQIRHLRDWRHSYSKTGQGQARSRCHKYPRTDTKAHRMLLQYKCVRMPQEKKTQRLHVLTPKILEPPTEHPKGDSLAN